MTDARAAQVAARVLVASPGDARVAQVAARALIQTKTESRLAGLSVDVATKPSPDSRLAGLSTDVAVVATPESRLAGLSVDVAVPVLGDPVASTAYTTAVLADTPLAYWRLEGAQDHTYARDYSGNNKHGLRSGGTDVYSPVDGGGAIQFANNITDRITIGPGNTWTGLTALTLECWFKIASNPSTLRGMVSNDNQGGTFTTRNWSLSISSTGIIAGIVFSGSSYSQLISSAGFANNQWHHVVFTYNGANTFFYMDGAQIGTAAFTGVINSSTGSNVRLGCEEVSGNAFPGILDECVVYGTALSAARVTAHYNARLATATYAQTSRESLRVATQTVGSAQLSRESLRVATQSPGAAQVSRLSTRVAVQAPGGVVGLYHQAVQAVVSTADVALYHQAVQAVVTYGPPATAPAFETAWSVWNGTAEVPASMTVWNGTAEVAGTIEFYEPYTRWFGKGVANGTLMTTAVLGTGDDAFTNVVTSVSYPVVTNTDLQFTFTTGNSTVQWVFTPTNWHMFRFDMVIPTTGMATSFQIVRFMDTAGNNLGYLNLAGAGTGIGKIRIQNPSGVTDIESTWQMAQGTRYTIQMLFGANGATNYCRLNAYNTATGALFGTLTTTTLPLGTGSQQVARYYMGAWFYATSGQQITMGDFAHQETDGTNLNAEIKFVWPATAP